MFFFDQQTCSNEYQCNHSGLTLNRMLCIHLWQYQQWYLSYSYFKIARFTLLNGEQILSENDAVQKTPCMSSLSIDFLQASTQSKGSHVKSHAGLHKCFLFMETSVQPRGYRAWKVPGFSMDFLFREFFTLPRGSHGKSQILPLTFSSQGIHTGQKISWEVQGLGFPMEFFFFTEASTHSHLQTACT